MTVTIIFLACLAAFGIAFRSYGRVLARAFGLRGDTQTPAHTLADGEDYVPIKRGYLLAQHFSAISAAGPIAGPITAGLMFGWLPALLWIVLGAIFIGAMHDFSALVGSVRHQARSVSEIVREHMSRPAWYLFLSFVWLALVYVVIAFTDLTARGFVGQVTLDDGSVVNGGGIATSSILYLAVSVVMGVCLRRKMPLWLATLIFVPLVGVAIWFGQHAPASVPTLIGSDEGVEGQVRTWDYLILVYCGIASVTPMWALLQPRGFLGGFFLYGVLAFSFLGILVGGGEVKYPMFLGFRTTEAQPLFPFLFITIACGACSGFHGLVCSGTTSKQLDREPDAHTVGYGGMLLEGVVAVISLICVMLLSPGSPASAQSPQRIYALGTAGFMNALGIDLKFAAAFSSLAFTTFVFDTLDVTTRLGRYILQELLHWKTRLGAVVATFISLVLPALFVSATLRDDAGKPIAAWKVFWTIFGSSNQLLAALTLLGLTVWLRSSGRRRAAWITGVPMVFMLGMTMWSLILMVSTTVARVRAGRTLDLPGAVAIVLLALATWLVVEAIRVVRRERVRTTA